MASTRQSMVDPRSDSLSYDCVFLQPFSKQQILDSSNPKEFADDNLKFGENGRMFSNRVENTVGKGEIFKRLLLQTRKNKGLFGKGLHKKSIWIFPILYRIVPLPFFMACPKRRLKSETNGCFLRNS